MVLLSLLRPLSLIRPTPVASPNRDGPTKFGEGPLEHLGDSAGLGGESNYSYGDAGSMGVEDETRKYGANVGDEFVGGAFPFASGVDIYGGQVEVQGQKVYLELLEPRHGPPALLLVCA